MLLITIIKYNLLMSRQNLIKKKASFRQPFYLNLYIINLIIINERYLAH